MVVFDIKFINKNFESYKDLQVAYLFKPNGKGVYLSYMLVVSNFKDGENFTNDDYESIKESRDNFRNFVKNNYNNSPVNLEINQELDLEDENQFAKAYKNGTLFYKYYELNDDNEFNVPEDEFEKDLLNYLNLFESLDLHYKVFKNHNFYTDPNRVTNGKNELYYGVPGSGKSCEIKRKLAEKSIDDSQIERVVFHPDYTYSDFIGQILPKLNDEKINYKFSPGPFTLILKEAFKNPEDEYFLVIEEINRGNAPAIFGDIFQLLDRDEEHEGYPLGTSEYSITNEYIADEIYEADELKFYGNKVRIPSNLSIFATMNTSDQNVFTLDTAFQRRWDMELIENKIDNENDNSFDDKIILDTGLSWKKFCYGINKKIIENNINLSSSEDKRLGTYFINEDVFVLGVNEGDGKYVEILEEKCKKFSEKVLKYLWDDAFKFSRDKIFNTKKYGSLDLIIKEFKNNEKEERFKVFKEGVYDDLSNIVFENNSEG